MKLSENFDSKEFECQCGCGKDDVSDALIAVLEEVRAEIGKPVIINSGCRCPAHNAAEGGVPMSTHTLGDAADVRISGGDERFRVARAAFRAGAMGVGIADTFVHIDVHDGVIKARPSSWGY